MYQLTVFINIWLIIIIAIITLLNISRSVYDIRYVQLWKLCNSSILQGKNMYTDWSHTKSCFVPNLAI